MVTSSLLTRPSPLVRFPTDGRYARQSNNRVVAIGDSETFNNDGGHFKQLCQRVSQRGLYCGYFATVGYTIEQIRDIHLPSVLALTGNNKPAYCVILAGTNNVGASSGTGFNFTTAKQAFLQITSALLAANIIPIICTIPPRGDVTLSNTNVRQWNAWLIATAAINGWPVLDYHSAVVNVSGQWSSGLSGDGIHFNGAGYRVATNATASTFASLFPAGGGPYVSRSGGDPQNLLPSFTHLFTSTASGGVAGGWSGSTGNGQVYSVITGDSSIVGNWQTLSRPLAATANAFLNVGGSYYITSGFAVGDRVAVAFLFQASGFETNINQSGAITLDFRDSGSTVISSRLPVYANASEMTNNYVAYAEGVVPANTAKIGVSATITGAATTTNGAALQFAQPTVINLTALGL